MTGSEQLLEEVYTALIGKKTKNKLNQIGICFMLVPVSNVVLLYPVLHLN